MVMDRNAAAPSLRAADSSTTLIELDIKQTSPKFFLLVAQLPLLHISVVTLIGKICQSLDFCCLRRDAATVTPQVPCGLAILALAKPSWSAYSSRNSVDHNQPEAYDLYRAPGHA